MSDAMMVARLLREALERVVPTDVASAVLFDALGSTGIPAPTRAAMLSFVEGPLREALERRLGAKEASGLFAMIRMPIENATRGTNRREETPTRHVKTVGTTPRAVVFDDGTGLGRRLLAAFGGDRLSVEVVRDGSELSSAGATLLIIDATTMAGAEPLAIAKACAWFGPEALRIVAGAETPFGARMIEAFATTGQAVVPVRIDHGSLPLIELVRSRMP